MAWPKKPADPDSQVLANTKSFAASRAATLVKLFSLKGISGGDCMQSGSNLPHPLRCRLRFR
jgi:hypothetical protein